MTSIREKDLLDHHPAGVVRLEEKAAFSTLVCPVSGQPLRRADDVLVTPDGKHSYPIVREIPRFVSSDHYTRSFSFEWNVHNSTQLDSHRTDGWSEETLCEKTGLTPEQVRGKLVLDAGVGAGRYAEVLSRWGATVVGVDLSFAVEAANGHFAGRSDVMLCQADIGALPFRPGTFDLIISIGVLHHTPDTRRYFSTLPGLLKPGGEIAIWVYPDSPDYVTRKHWVPFVHRIPRQWYYSWCKVFVPWAVGRNGTWLGRWLFRVFPFSNQSRGIENDILDTFDGFSPRFHGVHSPEEVKGWFRDAGLGDLCEYPDWRTAVRGKKAA
jgi:SAM-dependent methyltransferase